MKIFLICPVRNLTKEQNDKIEELIKIWEDRGDTVHFPPRDTTQIDDKGHGFYICLQNRDAIKEADEVYVWYDEASQGSHFDLGMAFALNKKIRLINIYELFNGKPPISGKSFPAMLEYWTNEKPVLSAL